VRHRAFVCGIYVAGRTCDEQLLVDPVQYWDDHVVTVSDDHGILWTQSIDKKIRSLDHLFRFDSVPDSIKCVLDGDRILRNVLRHVYGSISP